MSLEKKISSVKAFLTGEEGDENFIFFRHLHLEGRKTNKPPEGQKPRSQEQSWEGIFEGWGWSSWNQHKVRLSIQCHFEEGDGVVEINVLEGIHHNLANSKQQLENQF